MRRITPEMSRTNDLRKTPTLSASVSRELYDRVLATAEARNVTVSKIVGEALERYFADDRAEA